MRASYQSILQALRERRQATRPQLAEATGLSAVSVGKAVAELCRQGLVAEVEEAPSTGGRPALLYRYCAEKAHVAYLHLHEMGTALQVCVEFFDPLGKRLKQERATLAYLEPQITDSWLDVACARRHLLGITLKEHPALHNGLVEHLRQRYTCPVRVIRASDALADEREDCATLYLAPGQPPQCSLRRAGRLTPTGALEQLPLPARWATLDYSEPSLVTEILQWLLLLLS
mgnify:CR=1 FL=1